jgi:tRNA U34 5-carboxymethylaminomethyl modifying enzyme MnmG/GidA
MLHSKALHEKPGVSFFPPMPATYIWFDTLCCMGAGDEDVRWFSFDPDVQVPRDQMCCYLTHTTAETHRLIRENLQETPIYG